MITDLKRAHELYGFKLQCLFDVHVTSSYPCLTNARKIHTQPTLPQSVMFLPRFAIALHYCKDFTFKTRHYRQQRNNTTDVYSTLLSYVWSQEIHLNHQNTSTTSRLGETTATTLPS